MSGLLKRLAGQALGARGSGTAGIRPAASVHAQEPVSPPREGEDARAKQAEDSRTASQTPRSHAQEFTNVVQSIGSERRPDAQSNTSRPAEVPAKPAFASSPPTTEHASHEFVEKAPQLLLEEVQSVSAPSAITPATPAPLPVAVMSGGSRGESTEVHVHIGRIEVIAVPEPATPKKNRTTPARNTLPLADYLARRRRS